MCDPASAGDILRWEGPLLSCPFTMDGAGKGLITGLNYSVGVLLSPTHCPSVSAPAPSQLHARYRRSEGALTCEPEPLELCQAPVPQAEGESDPLGCHGRGMQCQRWRRKQQDGAQRFPSLCGWLGPGVHIRKRSVIAARASAAMGTAGLVLINLCCSSPQPRCP